MITPGSACDSGGLLTPAIVFLQIRLCGVQRAQPRRPGPGPQRQRLQGQKHQGRTEADKYPRHVARAWPRRIPWWRPWLLRWEGRIHEGRISRRLPGSRPRLRSLLRSVARSRAGWDGDYTDRYDDSLPRCTIRAGKGLFFAKG